MCDGECDTRGEQDERVDGWQAERRHDLVGAISARAECFRAVGGPAASVVLEQHQMLHGTLDAIARQPRHAELARVEQRTEEGGKEHHLGEDEPHHAHAEAAVHMEVVDALFVLADDRTEPADEQHGEHGKADRQD